MLRMKRGIQKCHQNGEKISTPPPLPGPPPPPMEGLGSKGRAAYGDRPIGAASCRRDHHTRASCQNPPPTPRGLGSRNELQSPPWHSRFHPLQPVAGLGGPREPQPTAMGSSPPTRACPHVVFGRWSCLPKRTAWGPTTPSHDTLGYLRAGQFPLHSIRRRGRTVRCAAQCEK